MKIHERAAQVWAVLALAARNRQVLTYDILSRLIGVPRHGLANILDHIQRYCMQSQSELPPLTILVVNHDTGIPGEGFIAAQDIPAAQVRVFDYDWLAHGAPTPDEFVAAVQAAQAGLGSTTTVP